MKNKYKYWCDLPLGTVVSNRIWQWKIIKNNHTEFSIEVIKSFRDNIGEIGNIYKYNISDKFILKGYEYILPHGYQSPLWKVLNGEEV